MNISGITIHSAKAQGTIHDLDLMIKAGTTGTSNVGYHYGIDSDGTIGLFVDEGSSVGATKYTRNDERTVQIICMNDKLDPDYTVTDACYNALIDLCEDICRRNFIDSLKYGSDKDRDSLTIHSQFEDIKCPGPYLASRMHAIAKDVNERLANTADYDYNTDYTTSYNIDYPALSQSILEDLRRQETITIRNTRPYVVKVEGSVKAKAINYNTLKNYGVIGVMIDAGQRYDSNHKLVKYRTDQVYSHALAASSANMPFAYYYTTHARTPLEVKEEAYWFYFVVSKYPPRLGVWLHCAFDVTSATAKKLVDKWYEYFVEWGFKSKCGLYCDKKQNSLIGWPDQCSYMNLWTEGGVSVHNCPDEEIIVPAFFTPGVQLEYSYSPGYAGGNTYNFSQTEYSDYSSYALPDSDLEEVGDANYQNPVTLKYGYDVDASTYTRREFSNYTEITIPKATNYRGQKKFENWSAITAVQSPAYKVTRSEYAYDVDGFRLGEGGVYMIAVGSGICRTAGTYLDLILQNGTVIKCITSDAKSDQHTDDKTHVFTCVNKNYCCSEFMVVQGALPSAVKSAGDCSKYKPAWNSPVAKVRVYKTNWATERGISVNWG